MTGQPAPEAGTQPPPSTPARPRVHVGTERLRRALPYVIVPVLAVVAGLLLSAIPILMTGVDPLTAYGVLLKAGFSCDRLERCALFSSFQVATPIILTGLSAVVAFRAGMFSLGQEGQLLLGGMTAAWVGAAFHLPVGIHALVAMAAGVAVGAVYGWFPGMLRVRLGVNEIISTIVLNSIAALSVTYLINFPLRADRSSTAHSAVIDVTAKLPIFLPGSKWGFGFVIAIAAVIAVALYLSRSTRGYEQRMAGEAPRFAFFGGVPSARAAIRGMTLSGALAGLAGAVQAQGVNYRMLEGFSGGIGFDGLTAAILGQVHPIATAITAVFFAGLRQGAQVGLQISTDIPRELGGGIIALMILFVALDRFFQERIRGVGARWSRLRHRPAPATPRS